MDLLQNLFRLHWSRSLRWGALLGGVIALPSLAAAQAMAAPPAKPATAVSKPAAPASAPAHRVYPEALVEAGESNFRQACAFCHGRGADGGEGGPDLTQSKLVAEDVDGDKIGGVVRKGRTDKGMPPFDYSDAKIASLAAFIHTRKYLAESKPGGRKGVAVADLQTGNLAAGRQYFVGAGGCANCHSATGDLSGIATRYEGLALEQRMLYPNSAKASVTVTRAGQTTIGTLAYLDEFTLALTDSKGVYHSWRTSDVQYKVDAPANAHIEQLPKYTDADVHNLMAYLQSLR